MKSKVAAWFRTVTVFMLFLMGVVFLSAGTSAPNPYNIPHCRNVQAMVKIKLAISPHKRVYSAGEVVTYNIEFILDKENPTYQTGYDYAIICSRDIPRGCEIVSSTLDSLIFLNDTNDRASGTIVFLCRNSMSLGILFGINRLTKSGQSQKLLNRDETLIRELMFDDGTFDRTYTITLSDKATYEGLMKSIVGKTLPGNVEYVGEDIVLPSPPQKSNK